MKSTHPVLVTCLIAILSTAFLSLSALSQDQIIAELDTLQASTPNGFKARILASQDFLVADQATTPGLCGMVHDFARRVRICKPTVLVYAGRDRHLANSCVAIALHHWLGVVIVGHAAIRNLPLPALESLIAHEVGHLYHGHSLTGWPLRLASWWTGLLNNVAKKIEQVAFRIPLIERLHGESLAMSNTVSCLHETQADLIAVALLDEPLELVAGLEKLDEIFNVSPETLELLRKDPYLVFMLDHPTTERRKAYITFEAEKKTRAS